MPTVRLATSLALAAALAIAVPAPAAAQDPDALCGTSPPLADEHVSAEIEAKFAGLRWWEVGGAGRYEQNTEEVLSRYPDADRLLINLAIFRTMCLVLLAEGEMTQREKVDELSALRREILGGAISGDATSRNEDSVRLPSYFMPRADWRRVVEGPPVETRRVRLVADLDADCQGSAAVLGVLSNFAPDGIDTAKFATPADTPHEQRRQMREIGRASCREIVCHRV